MNFVDFGYCLWLLCEKDEEINKLQNGFEGHISILTNMNLTEGLDLYECLDKDISIIVDVEPERVVSYYNGFNSIYFKVKYSDENKKKEPQWWPKDAHISIRYKYNEKFTEDELRIKLFDNKCKMRGIKLMRCRGHYSDWKCIM